MVRFRIFGGRDGVKETHDADEAIESSEPGMINVVDTDERQDVYKTENDGSWTKLDKLSKEK